MKILKALVKFSTVLAVCACNIGTTTKAEAEKTYSIRANDYKVANNTSIQDEDDIRSADTVTIIRFPELTLSLNRLRIWDEESKLKQPQKDTASIYAELGETIEGQQISVASDQLNGIAIEQRYETSVGISNEGPHCDLTEWKHYYSEWKPLKQIGNGQFITLTYDVKEAERFIEVPISELKEKVREQCGEEWYKLVKNIKSPNEYPSSVGISRYFLRVTGKQKNDGKTIKKTIIIEIPMGC